MRGGWGMGVRGGWERIGDKSPIAAFTLRIVGFLSCRKVKSTIAEPSKSPLSSRLLFLQLTRPGGVSEMRRARRTQTK